MEAEKTAVKNQLKLAQTRIEGLQSALKGGDSDEEEEISSTFLDHHRRGMSVQRERSLTREVSIGRELRASSMTRETRASLAREFEAVTRDFLSTREENREPVTVSVTPQSVNKDKTFESIAEVE